MAAIKSGPSERELSKLLPKILPLAKFWSKRRNIPRVKFVLGPKSRLGKTGEFGKEIKVIISHITFKRAFIYFEGKVGLKEGIFKVWGYYRKDHQCGYPRGRIELK